MPEFGRNPSIRKKSRNLRGKINYCGKISLTLYKRSTIVGKSRWHPIEWTIIVHIILNNGCAKMKSRWRWDAYSESMIDDIVGTLDMFSAHNGSNEWGRIASFFFQRFEALFTSSLQWYWSVTNIKRRIRRRWARNRIFWIVIKFYFGIFADSLRLSLKLMCVL